MTGREIGACCFLYPSLGQGRVRTRQITTCTQCPLVSPKVWAQSPMTSYHIYCSHRAEAGN